MRATAAVFALTLFACHHAPKSDAIGARADNGGGAAPPIEVTAEPGASADPALAVSCDDNPCRLRGSGGLDVALEPVAGEGAASWSTWLELRPGERVLASMVRLDDRHGMAGSEMDEIEYLLVVTSGKQKLAEIWWGGEQGEGDRKCDSKVVASDRDGDGARELITVATHCVSPFCDHPSEDSERSGMCEGYQPDSTEEWTRQPDGSFSEPPGTSLDDF